MILRAELQMSFYGVKLKNPKENLRFSKISQTGLGVLSLRERGGGVNKIIEYGKYNPPS